MNIWEMMYDRFQFKKDKITLFESFAGIGSQHLALKRLSNELGFELECVGISEIDKYAIAAYNAIHGEVKNYGSICDIQEIPQVDIFTYSFPCQDISLAGKQKGFDRGDNTRSGLLWEVERLLDNQHAIGKLPKVLLMENVKALVSEKFKDNYIEWQLKLQSLGYTNYWEVLNAKNYGIPQNRERVFMVSILGEYSYTFPKPFELKLRLKDMLEDEVDEKYYLSDKMLKYIYSFDNDNKKNGSGTYQVSKNSLQIDRDIAVPITTREGNTRADSSTYVSVAGNVNPSGRGMNGNIYDGNIAPTLTTNKGEGIKILEATDKIIVVALDGSTTYEHNQRVHSIDGIHPTIPAGENHLSKIQDNNLRIRKLTPLETHRLMGFNDTTHQARKDAGISDSQCYKQDGNSIVVDVIYYIFKELF